MPDYVVLNPYNQPKGEPVLSGPRRPEDQLRPGDDKPVQRAWYEGETIPGELLNARQIQGWVTQGVIEAV